MRGIVGLHLENAEQYPRLGESLVAMVVGVSSREPDGRGRFQGVGQPRHAHPSAPRLDMAIAESTAISGPYEPGVIGHRGDNDQRKGGASCYSLRLSLSA
jgi:hypothetical protein